MTIIVLEEYKINLGPHYSHYLPLNYNKNTLFQFGENSEKICHHWRVLAMISIGKLNMF